jgi:hypothetical protein
MHELFAKYLDNMASPMEVKQLLALFNFPENEAELRKLILDCLEYIDYDDDMTQCKSITEKKLGSIIGKIKAGNGKVVSLLNNQWFKTALANSFTIPLYIQF